MKSTYLRKKLFISVGSILMYNTNDSVWQCILTFLILELGKDFAKLRSLSLPCHIYLEDYYFYIYN